MQRKSLNSDKLRSAGYDEREQHLEIEYSDRSITVFKHVPLEVWRRLIAAPNPAAYYDDRIAEEYPRERGSTGSGRRRTRQARRAVRAADEEVSDLRVALYCVVVDNLGDAGVCWRLARQLAAEHACAVELFIDLPQALAVARAGRGARAGGGAGDFGVRARP